MRAVIDTNVLFSALYRPDSDPGRILLLAAEGALDLFAPASVREELERVLRGNLGYSEPEWRVTLESLPVRWIEHEEYRDFLDRARAAIRDASDAPLVAVALLLRTGVVSGDRDFHPLREPLVPTWRPRHAARDLAPPRKRHGRRARPRSRR